MEAGAVGNRTSGARTTGEPGVGASRRRRPSPPAARAYVSADVASKRRRWIGAPRAYVHTWPSQDCRHLLYLLTVF